MSRQIKTIGIVGGLGPESTIEYYRQIIARYREQISDGSYPPIIIHSMDVRELLRQCGANEFGKVRDKIVEAIQSLARAGAQFGLIASNTPHIARNRNCQYRILRYRYYQMRTIHLKILPFGICLLATGILADAVPVQQQAQSFTITLEGSVAEVTPLFGPVREREWAPDWAPHFIHPAQGGQEEGAVFTTKSANGQERLWLLTTYNVEQGKVEYVVITHGFTANQITIQITPDGEKQSKATITYRHSALAPEGNEEVGKLSPDWAAHQRAHWESAINSVLAKELRHD